MKRMDVKRMAAERDDEGRKPEIDPNDRFFAAAQRHRARPCPFCGGPATSGALYGPKDDQTPSHIRCADEDCPGSEVRGVDLEWWNRRRD